KGFDRTKLINYLQKEDISKIVSTYKFREEIGGYSHRASLDAIKRNDFNLNIPRYVDTYVEEKSIDAKKLVSKHKSISEEIKKVTKEIEETYKELNIENDLFR
ncbi:MAG: SAM-dependent DNA methyltransferase, partial [Methanobrevibacter sp.]|nr:SAM-dependent DNA methyltransferase [Methanobrevibacter sp.]